MTNAVCYGCKSVSGKIGILIAQLGTPEAPTAKAVKPYLKRFLSDPRVIEKPRWLWWIILNCIILVLRPKKSAKLYQRIWTTEGSPLEVITKRQVSALSTVLKRYSQHFEVVYGMRYSAPSIESAIDELIKRGCDKLILVNMYPQYSCSTVASNYDAVFKHLLTKRVIPTLKVLEPYFNNPIYLDALAQSINSYLTTERPERLVISFHGVPESYVEKGDLYCCQCSETVRLLKPRLKINPEHIIHTFQSRFGKDPWLEPYTDETIEALAKQGIKHIAVACPGFTTDCLETLDELGNEASELFHEHGGKTLDLIPCLNDSPNWISGLSSLILEESGSWLKSLERLSANCESFVCPNKIAKKKV